MEIRIDEARVRKEDGRWKVQFTDGTAHVVETVHVSHVHVADRHGSERLAGNAYQHRTDQDDLQEQARVALELARTLRRMGDAR